MLQERQESGVLSDVVGGDPEVAVQLDRIAARRVINPDAVSRGTGIAPRPTVDVRDECGAATLLSSSAESHRAGCSAPGADLMAASSGTYRYLLQESQAISPSARRTC